MINTSQGLKLEVIWFDDDMLELKVCALNSMFSGQSTFYASLNEPTTFANHISGFPKSTGDVREYEFGGTDLTGYGGAKIRMSCKDGRGNLDFKVSISLTLFGDVQELETTTLHFATVPSAIDSFVEDLRKMQIRVGDNAKLQSA
jgi:hypothetical protein